MSTISSSSGVGNYASSVGTRPTDMFAGMTAAERAALSPDVVAGLEQGGKIAAYLNQRDLASQTGAPSPAYLMPKAVAQPAKPVALTNAQVVQKFGTTAVLYSRSTTTDADYQALLHPKKFENHDARLGDVSSMDAVSLKYMIGMVANGINTSSFKGVNVYGNNGKQTTTSADVFLGWLKAASSGLESGAFISKTA